MMDTAIGKERLIDLVERLKTELQALPRNEPIERALYHCDRLQLAIRSSHSEGIRFAAFTLNRLLRDHRADLTPDAAGHLDVLRAELKAAGVDVESKQEKVEK
jgi:hypothetical protein